jgi:hypothetical protein
VKKSRFRSQCHDLLKPILSLASMGLIFAFHLLWRLLLPSLGVRERTWRRSGKLRQACWLPLTNFGTATGKQLLQDIGQITHKMKSVGDLPGMGSSFSRGGSVISSPITADDLHFGMFTYPLGEAFTGAVCQQVNHFAPL